MVSTKNVAHEFLYENVLRRVNYQARVPPALALPDVHHGVEARSDFAHHLALKRADCVCVCVCARVCACVCVRVCMYVCMYTCVGPI